MEAGKFHQSLISKSGHRFSERIMLNKRLERDDVCEEK
jgi:hypothetical protein